MFTPQPGVRYDMPPVFGPTWIPDRTVIGRSQRLFHSYVTEAGALAPLVPYHFTLPEPAKIVISSSMLMDVDWLGGRDYHTVRISAEVERRHDGRTLRGPYGLVVWESDPFACFAGREYLGVSKIYGDVPPHEQGDDSAAFEVYEYGTRLLRGELSNLRQADDATVAALNDRQATMFGWKYIPGPFGTCDVDAVVETVAHGSPKAMWVGESTLTWDEPTWQQCPHSARIVEALAALPVVEVLPARLTRSEGTVLDRAATRRLD